MELCFLVGAARCSLVPDAACVLPSSDELDPSRDILKHRFLIISPPVGSVLETYGCMNREVLRAETFS